MKIGDVVKIDFFGVIAIVISLKKTCYTAWVFSESETRVPWINSFQTIRKDIEMKIL